MVTAPVLRQSPASLEAGACATAAERLVRIRIPSERPKLRFCAMFLFELEHPMA
jgi:hypothetical protein